MQPSLADSPSLRIYHLGFVVLLMALFLFVMFMTARQQGTGNFETSFFQRALLIENYNRLRLKLGDRVFNNVLIGKNGWMEYTGGGNLDDYQNASRFTPAKLEAAAAAIEACYQYAREHGMTFLVVVAPNKASIYPDKLPEEIQPLSGLSRLDQLNHYLREHDVPEVLDLRPALRAARQDQAIYYERGTHWNEYGAYIAYKSIIDTLSQEYPALEPYPSKFFRFRNILPSRRGRSDEALANLIQAKYLVPEPAWFATRDLNDIFHELNFGDEKKDYHQITWIPGSDLPTLLVFHDSFGSYGLNRFLSLNFGKAFFIHRHSSPLFLNTKSFEQFSPAILIYEVVERTLFALPTDLAACAED